MSSNHEIHHNDVTDLLFELALNIHNSMAYDVL
jgi:hypothetical protein